MMFSDLCSQSSRQCGSTLILIYGSPILTGQGQIKMRSATSSFMISDSRRCSDTWNTILHVFFLVLFSVFFCVLCFFIINLKIINQSPSIIILYKSRLKLSLKILIKKTTIICELRLHFVTRSESLFENIVMVVF